MDRTTWLVTGGAGFIGNTVVRQLLEVPGHEVVNLDLLTYAGHPGSVRELAGETRHRFVQGDIGDRALVRGLLREFRPHAVLNLAAESHVDRSIDGPRAFAMTNVIGVVDLLDEVRDYWEELTGEERERFRFLQVSTCLLYTSPSPRDS